MKAMLLDDNKVPALALRCYANPRRRDAPRRADAVKGEKSSRTRQGELRNDGYSAVMRQIRPFYLFLLLVWCPLPLLPGVRLEDIIGPLGVTLMGGLWKLLTKLPNPGGPDLTKVGGHKKVSWRNFLFVVAGLEVVLLAFLWEFAAGQEQVEPYAGWLAPLGEAMTQMLPKFRLMAGQLDEMGLSHRVNVVLVAFGTAYVWQPVLAALWLAPVYRLFRVGVAQGSFPMRRGWRRFGHTVALWVSLAALLAMVVLIPETGTTHGRMAFFPEFESRDVHLFYQCVVYVTAYCQILMLVTVWMVVWHFPRLGKAAPPAKGNARGDVPTPQQ